MRDFLNFNTFITQDVLIFFYYIGAILVPILLYFFKNYLIQNVLFIQKVDAKIKTFYNTFKAKQKLFFWILFTLLFLFMELFWRMIFEAMIGYFDMHEYLYRLSHTLH